ncbi:hypothetical protein GCM10010116_23150 [Microbispora rosea subsp. aerata]|nr:hypothetical protein GCM10010116_23150 [Microbispora rosea subsp. aerata]GIH55756.1 hypothetical protein Mro02_26700 [Microbispora rosea subsp. aerata]GLJ85946.1 hypothetical protein GCM10017588_46790 [Microbispora rosea subsp. aerata]
MRERSDGDVRTTLACASRSLPALPDLPGHSRVIGLPNGIDIAAWKAEVAAVHARDPFDAVVAFGERDQDRLAELANELGMLWHSPQTVRWVYDKAAMRERLHDLLLDDTPYCRVDGPGDLRKFLREVGGPVVIKPLDGSASVGVSLLENSDDAEAGYLRAANVGKWSSGGVLAEAMIPGRQFSVECFTAEGRHTVLAVVEKFSDPRRFVELGHLCPARLDTAETARIGAYVTEVLTALGVGFGPTHTEVVLGPNGPRIIETHLRMGGDEIPRLVFDVTGFDLEAATVDQIIGRPGPVSPGLGGSGEAASAIWFLAPDTSGVLEAIRGVEAARAMPGVTEVHVDLVPGSSVEPLLSSVSRGGYVRSLAKDPTAALNVAREAAAQVIFLVSSAYNPFEATL